MPSTYAGDPTNYPANLTVPSDGDDEDAASVNAALEGLADRTANLKGRMQIVGVLKGGVDDASSAHAQQGGDITSGSFVDTALSWTSTFGVKAGDVVKFDLQVWAKTTAAAGTPGRLRLRGASGEYINHSIVDTTLDGAPACLTLTGWYVVPVDAVALTMVLQARKGDTDVQILAPVSFTAVTYRS